MTIAAQSAGTTAIQGLSIWPWLDTCDNRSRSPLLETNNWPRISIVTPNFNYGHLIEMTMRSVILQSYPNLEYIVIDDGSTDESVKVIDRYSSQLAYFEHQSNQGQYPTINKGFSKATGEICGWLNSDDIYLPWTLKTVATIFSRFPDVHWIHGHVTQIQDGVVHAVGPYRPFPREMIRAGLFHEIGGGYGYIQQESCFWRRRLWEKAGGLRTDLGYAADFELWTRFARHEKLHAVSTILGGFTERMNQNRSRLNRQQYINDVDKSIREIRRDPNSCEARLARRLARHEYVAGRLSYRVANKFFSVRDLRGPTLMWDFSQGCYVAGTASIF